MIEQGITSSFLYELPLGTHALQVDTLKMALYVSTADIGRSTTTYTASGEVPVGLGYATGGVTLTNVTVNVDSVSGVSYISFDSPEWQNASFTARGALIYNSSKGDRSVAVLNFGDDKNAGGRTFRATVPANTSTTAIIKLVRGQ